MSALIISHDLQIMMLELAIEKITNPKSNTINKTTVMCRIVDEWLSIPPYVENNFHGGTSVLFAIPSKNLQRKVSDLNIEVNIRTDTIKSLEMQTCFDIGWACVPIKSLFNGIIKELQERKDMRKHFSYFHAREPISKSIKETYMIANERNTDNPASITIYTRLNYFGKSIITEIECFPNDEFHVHEETSESNPYQCREVSRTQLVIGCWNSNDSVHSSPVKQKDLICLDDVNILPGVKAGVEGALDGVEQWGITTNATSNTGKGEEFTSDSGGIVQGISKQPSTNGKVTMINKENKGLDNVDAGRYGGDESKVEDTDQPAKNSGKKSKKRKKKTKINDKSRKKTTN